VSTTFHDKEHEKGYGWCCLCKLHFPMFRLNAVSASVVSINKVMRNNQKHSSDADNDSGNQNAI